jgi:hypothetical protein
MPGGDRTGPMGMGPMTGRAAGYCAGYDAPGYANWFSGRGPGMGWWGGWGGRGRGWRHRYYATGLPFWARGYAPAWEVGPMYGPPAPPSREEQAGALKAQAEWLRAELEAIQQRLSALDQEEDE